LIILLFPWASRRISRRPALSGWLSPVVLCYALGILLGNVSLLPLDAGLAKNMTEATIVLAIPLLLFSTDLKVWSRQSRTVLLSFGLCVLSGLLATQLVAFLFRNRMEDSWQIAGMLVGIYTGGTPNMQAIGLALDAGQEKIVLLNAADILCGGILLLFLTSVAHRLYGLFLSNYQIKSEMTANDPMTAGGKIDRRHVVLAIGLSAAIVGASLGLSYLFFRDLTHTAVIILLLTTLSIAASFSKKVRNWRGAYEAGDYFLLMFCVALGMLADFQVLIDQGGELILFTGLALSATLLLHLFLSYLFHIDRDTTIITFTAASYGPAFIGQIAQTIGNKQLVFAGIAMGLLGYAIGNYLGISTAYFLRWLF
jgi:uncharacterized membrane protein